MCPVIANNGGSGSLVSLLASPWSARCVIFNWLVLSPQKKNPLIKINIYRRYSHGRRALLRSNCVPDSAVTLLCCVSFLVCVELCAKWSRFWFQISDLRLIRGHVSWWPDGGLRGGSDVIKKQDLPTYILRRRRSLANLSMHTSSSSDCGNKTLIVFLIERN